MGIVIFTSSFIKGALQQNARHVNIFFIMGLWNSNSLFHATHILFFMMHTFIFHLHRVFYSFKFFFHKMFGCLLGPRSLDSLEGLLARQQASLPITLSGVGFISTSTITLTTYLGSWVLVISIIVVRFMVD